MGTTLPPLYTLPIELFHEIFDHIPHHRTPRSGVCRYEPELFALRLVSKTLYFQTSKLFGIRCRHAFVNGRFIASPAGLAFFHAFSAVRYLRERLQQVRLVREDLWRDPEKMRCMDWWPQSWEEDTWKQMSQVEHRAEYENSPETYHLLKATFDNLSNFTRPIKFEFTAGATLRALEDSTLNQKIGQLLIDPLEVLNEVGEPTWGNITDCIHKLRSIEIRWASHEKHATLEGYWGSWAHYAGARYTSPALTNLLEATRMLEEIHIQGCQDDHYGSVDMDRQTV